MTSNNPRNPIEIFRNKLELQTAGKIFVLVFAELHQENRKDKDNPTDEELKAEIQAGNNFGNRMMCWAEAYHQLRESGEIDADIFKDYDPDLVAQERKEWRGMYEKSILFMKGESENDERFK